MSSVGRRACHRAGSENPEGAVSSPAALHQAVPERLLVHFPLGRAGQVGQGEKLPGDLVPGNPDCAGLSIGRCPASDQRPAPRRPPAPLATVDRAPRQPLLCTLRSSRPGSGLARLHAHGLKNRIAVLAGPMEIPSGIARTRICRVMRQPPNCDHRSCFSVSGAVIADQPGSLNPDGPEGAKSCPCLPTLLCGPHSRNTVLHSHSATLCHP